MRDFDGNLLYLGHLLVGEEVLLVLGVLEVVLLEVGPQLLDALGPGRLLLADQLGQLGGEPHGLDKTAAASGHGEIVVVEGEEE